MRLLLITQFFPPETGATQNRLGALVRACREADINVTVLTAMPHYPFGRVFPEYRGHWMRTETTQDAHVIRAWLYAHGRGKWSRILSFISFAVSALLAGLLHAPRADVVMWESPPLSLGVTAVLLAKIKGARLVTNVADLWPASIIALGELKDGIAARLLTAFELFVYRRSTLISGQTKAIVADIARRVPTARVVHWGNGADPTTDCRPDTNRWRQRWGIAPERFVVGYAGLFGVAQGLEIIPHVAALTPDVDYVLVGDGPARPIIVAAAKDLSLENVIFVPPQPHSEMPTIWAAFDCTAICLRDVLLFRGAVPSKLFEAMAAGTPIILAVAGEAAGLVKEAGCGLTVPPGDAVAVATAIRRLQQNPEERKKMGRRGQQAASERFNRQALNREFVATLQSLLGGNRAV